MFLEPTPGDDSPAPFTLPTYRQETLRHILLGDYGAVTDAIGQLVARATATASPGQTPSPPGAAANTSPS